MHGRNDVLDLSVIRAPEADSQQLPVCHYETKPISDPDLNCDLIASLKGITHDGN